MKLEYGMTKEEVLTTIPSRGVFQTGMYDLAINDFIKSGADAVKIQPDPNKKYMTVYNGFAQAIKRRKPPVTVISRNKELYLLRND